MTAREVLNLIVAAGGSVAVEGDKLKLQAPEPLPADVMDLAREHKPELLELLTHPDLRELTAEFNRTGRIRIEAIEGAAWLVESYDLAADIRTGAVYSQEVWPHFVRLDPQHKLQIHRFLCGLGGGRFDGIKFENAGEGQAE